MTLANLVKRFDEKSLQDQKSYDLFISHSAKDYIRIIEYKKLPIQNVTWTTYGVEYSLPYKAGEFNEPYYPLLTSDSQKQYKQYKIIASKIKNLFICGRLGNFKYYNMDQAIKNAIIVAKSLLIH